MVAGVDSVATRVIRMRNTAASPVLYAMDGVEMLRVMDDIEDTGQELVAIYHSHTRSKAFPSRTDVELAFYPTTPYLIISLEDRDHPVLRAFMLSRTAPADEAVREVPVEIK